MTQHFEAVSTAENPTAPGWYVAHDGDILNTASHYWTGTEWRTHEPAATFSQPASPTHWLRPVTAPADLEQDIRQTIARIVLSIEPIDKCIRVAAQQCATIAAQHYAPDDRSTFRSQYYDMKATAKKLEEENKRLRTALEHIASPHGRNAAAPQTEIACHMRLANEALSPSNQQQA